MKKLIFAISFAILILGCSKIKQIYIDDSQTSKIEIDIEEQKNPFYVNESKYQVFGKIKPTYELGFDDNNHAFLTDTHSNSQVVFMCDEYGYYTKEDYLHIYDITIKEDLDLKEKLADKIEDLKPYAQKQETVYSDHFKANITRYFVSYKAVYGHFHI